MASAVCHVILPAGSGSNSGADWNNACNGFTGNCAPGNAAQHMARGDTYYVGKGTYSTPSLSTNTSAALDITIKAPTASDNCTATGFNAGTMVGQAVLNGRMIISTDHWIINGQYGTENSGGGATKGSFGFLLHDTTAGDNDLTINASNVTLQYMEVQGDNNPNGCTSTGGAVGIFMGQSGSAFSNITASHVYIYQVNNHFKINNVTNPIVDHATLTENYSATGCHGENIAENSATNTTVRYSYFENCRGTACVAAGACGFCAINQGSQYYGNVYNFTSDYTSLGSDPLSNGIFHTITGSGWNNAVLYNQTVANCTSSVGGGCATFTDNGSGTNTNMTVRNTLFLGNSASMGITAASCSNNSYWSQTRATTCNNDETGKSGSPVVKASITQGQLPNFNLSQDTATWFSLSAPFNADPDGIARTTSRGAYQFEGAGGGGVVSGTLQVQGGVQFQGGVVMGVDTSLTIPDTFLGMHDHSSTITFPTIPQSVVRMWDTNGPAAQWGNINSADTVYDWTRLDAWITWAQAHNLTLIYVMGKVPSFASSNPAQNCNAAPAGSCAPPDDVAADGTGTDHHVIQFITDFWAHVAGGGNCATIPYIEEWNEPNGPTFWTGNNAQLARIAKDIYQTTKASGCPGTIVMSPGVSGGVTGPSTFIPPYCNDPSNPLVYADILDYHGYSFSQTPGNYPIAESLLNLVTNTNAAYNNCPAGLGKFRWITEDGWGDTSGNGFCNQGPYPTNTCGQTGVYADHAGYLVQKGILAASTDAIGWNWYAYDNGADPSGNPSGLMFNNALLPSGIAHGILHDWITGAKVQPAVQDSVTKTWTVELDKVNGYLAMAVWNRITVPTTWTPPVSLVQCRDISGNLFPITPGQPITISYDPLLCENQNPFMIITSGSPLPSGTVGVAYSTSITASGSSPVFTEVTMPGVFATTGLTLDSNGLLHGTPTTAGTFKTQVRARATGSGGQSYATNFTIVIAPSGGTCGPPTYPCSSRSAAVIQQPTPPFQSSVGLNQIAYDTSINPTGTDPIVRATDSSLSQLSFTITPSGGANDKIWNANDTILIVSDGSGGRHPIFFNPATMQVSTPSPILTINNAGGGITCTYSDPNVCYTLKQNTGQIYKVTFSGQTFTQTLFYDSPTACAALNGFTTSSAGPISISLNDDVIYFPMAGSGQNTGGKIAVYKISTNQCSVLDTVTGQVAFYDGSLHQSTLPCFPIAIHAGYIFRNGNYGQFSTGTIGACTNHEHLWQFGTTNVFVCSSAANNGTCQGHDTVGYNVIVLGSHPFYHADVTNSANFPPTLTYGNSPTTSDTHFGTPFIDSGDTTPILGETDHINWNGSPFTQAMDNEIYALTRAGVFIRFAHNFTSSQTLCPTCDFRSFNAIGAGTQDGKFWAFTSDMRAGLGTDSQSKQRSDVFIIRLD